MVLSVCADAVHHQHGGDDGQRNGGQNDERQPPVAEEQQDHQGGQACRHRAAHEDAVERRLDENRLVEDRLDVDTPFGRSLLDVRQGFVDAIDHRQRRDAAGFADRSSARRAAVDGDRIGLHLIAIMHVGDIAHEDRFAVDFLDRENR